MIISGKNTIYEQLVNQKRKQPRLKGWKNRKRFAIDCGGVNVTQLATLFRMSACWFPSEQFKLSAESKTRTHVQKNANGDGWRKGMWHTVYVSSDITSHHPPLIFHTFSSPSKQSHYLLLIPWSAIDHRGHKGASPFSIKPTRFSLVRHQSKQPECVWQTLTITNHADLGWGRLNSHQ